MKIKVHAASRLHASVEDDCRFLNDVVFGLTGLNKIKPAQFKDGIFELNPKQESTAYNNIIKLNPGSLKGAGDHGNDIRKTYEVEGRKVYIDHNRYGGGAGRVTLT